MGGRKRSPKIDNADIRVGDWDYQAVGRGRTNQLPTFINRIIIYQVYNTALFVKNCRLHSLNGAAQATKRPRLHQARLSTSNPAHSLP